MLAEKSKRKIISNKPDKRIKDDGSPMPEASGEKSRRKTIRNKPGKKKKDDSFHMRHASGEGYDGRDSRNLSIEKKSSMTFEQERNWNPTPETLPNPLMDISVFDANCILEDFLSAFAGNISCLELLHNRRQIRGNEKLVHLAENYLKQTLSKTVTMQLLMKLFTDIPQFCNLPSLLSLTDVLMEQKKDDFDIQFLKNTFFPAFYGIVSQNVGSNALRGEEILNNHMTCRRHPRHMKMPKLNNCPISQSELVPFGDVMSGEYNINHQIKLRCVFTNNVDIEGITSINKSWANEDIKMILPTTWSIVVTNNLVTISDENNQTIRIFFRNILKAKVDYEHFNSSKYKDFQSSDTVESVVQRVQENVNSPCRKRRTDSTNSKWMHAFSRKGTDYLLPLQVPILLNYVEEKTLKQIMIYKTHSLQDIPKGENSKTFCKILEALVDKCVQYDDEPVNLVFEPLQLIAKLKQEEQNRTHLIRAHSSRGIHNLMDNFAFKKILKLKDNQKLNKTPKESRGKTYITSVSKVEYNSQNENKHRNKISVKSISLNPIYLEDSKPTKTSSPSVMKYSDINVFRENRPTLKFRLRPKNRTALKRVNVKKIVSSVFKYFFHFYSVLGGQLKSGAVITKSNSNYWLKVSGIATDSCTLRLAGELFTAVAGTKVVLNIYDYIKFIVVFAKSKRLIVGEVVKQMMVYEHSSLPNVRKKYKKFTKFKNPEEESTKVYHEDNQLASSKSFSKKFIEIKKRKEEKTGIYHSQSLPDLRDIS